MLLTGDYGGKCEHGYRARRSGAAARNLVTLAGRESGVLGLPSRVRVVLLPRIPIWVRLAAVTWRDAVSRATGPALMV